jgi:hypothetical protein
MCLDDPDDGIDSQRSIASVAGGRSRAPA